MPKKKSSPEEPAAKIAVPKEAAPEAHPATKSTKVGKLKKKNRARLPRRQKKALKKAAEKSS